MSKFGDGIRRFFERHVPMRVYRALYKTFYILKGTAGKTPEDGSLLPPEDKSFVYGYNFKETGDEYLKLFTDVAKLLPGEKFLDIGCGIGRIALPLMRHLSSEGEYRGFDIIGEGIDWCKENISSTHSNFRFDLVDLYNKSYNPAGKLSASDFKFPYKDNYFDFACATSVFTHMLPEDLKNYIKEVARVLRPGGRSFLTFFVMNEETKKLLDEGASNYDFRYKTEEYVTISQSEPEKAIAYEESYIRKVYEENGLVVEEPVRYGSWSGRKEFLGGQDIIFAIKK